MVQAYKYLGVWLSTNQSYNGVIPFRLIPWGLPTLSNLIPFRLAKCEKVPFGLIFVQLTLDHNCNNNISTVWSDKFTTK